MNLGEWAERVIREVDEHGRGAVRIRLCSTDGMAWETWFAPFGEPQDWTERAERVVLQLLEDWPQQQIQLLFIAEDQAGNVLSQCTKTTRGRSKLSTNDMFGGPSKALAESMDAQARTMDRILSSANHQIELLTKALDAQTRVSEAQLAELQLRRTEEAEQRGVNPELVEQALQLVPALVQTIFERPAAAEVAQAAVNNAAKAAGGK